MRAISELKPFAGNSRLHSDGQIDQIAASIQEFGFTVPVLADEEGTITAGHARVLAAGRLGMVEVPTIDTSYLTPQQRRAYVIADNKLALNASWDEGILASELAELSLDGFDLDLTGFSLGDLKGLGIGGPGEAGDAPRQEVPSSWAVIIDCTDEADQVALIERLQAEGRKVKRSIG